MSTLLLVSLTLLTGVTDAWAAIGESATMLRPASATMPRPSDALSTPRPAVNCEARYCRTTVMAMATIAVTPPARITAAIRPESGADMGGCLQAGGGSAAGGDAVVRVMRCAGASGVD